ncbi:hypothetical protein [Streptomyces virginiae]
MSLADIVRAQGQHRGLPPRKLRTIAYNAERRTEAAEAAAEELQQQLDTAGIELSGLQLDLETARAEGIRLRAALDNATTVHVAAALGRDIWPGDEDTHPIDVSEIRDRYGSTDPAAYAPMRLAEAATVDAL